MIATVENGASYAISIRCTKFEKLLVNHAHMLRELRHSGLENVEFTSVKTGFEVRGTYVGQSGEVTLPERVTRIKRVK